MKRDDKEIKDVNYNTVTVDAKVPTPNNKIQLGNYSSITKTSAKKVVRLGRVASGLSLHASSYRTYIIEPGSGTGIKPSAPATGLRTSRGERRQLSKSRSALSLHSSNRSEPHFKP